MDRVLLMDLVGTLLDEQSEYEALDAAMEAARLRFGIDDDATALSGDFSLALMEILRQEPEEDETPVEIVPFERAAKDIFSAVLEVRGVQATAQDVHWFWAIFVEQQRALVRLHADALPALDWARKQGWRVIVLTDADPYVITDVLPPTGILKRIDGTVTAAEAGEPKPSPRIFQAALQKADVPPVAAVMVGDSYERDVLGARAAGIPRAVLVDRHKARTVKDVPVISTLSALPAALATLPPGDN